MSLAFTQTLSSGVDVTFWTIDSIAADMITHTAVIKMNGYIDSDAHTNGMDPATNTYIAVVLVPTTVFPGISLITALYSKITQDPFFDGAVYTADGL